MTPPQDPGMDGTVRRTSRRIKEKQNQEKKQTLTPKCLTFTSEVKRPPLWNILVLAVIMNVYIDYYILFLEK